MVARDPLISGPHLSTQVVFYHDANEHLAEWDHWCTIFALAKYKKVAAQYVCQ